MKVPFFVADLTDREFSGVASVLESGWLTTGKVTKQFEITFSNFLGGGEIKALAVNSATAGLHLALDAINIKPGDEVITTTHTFTATAEVIRYMGAKPVFVDVDPTTLCLNIDEVESAITSATKAIMPVHFGGLSADMPKLLALASKHDLRVVEDAAHALPSTCDGKLIGSLESDITVFSFYANKTMTTGEGGMLVTRDASIAQRVAQMRLHGISRDAFDRFNSDKPSWYYEVVAPGFKYNMTDIAAAIGLPQLERVEIFQQKRECVAKRYSAAFGNLPICLPAAAKPGDLHSWHLYVIRLKPECMISRDRFIDEMYYRGVACSVHYIPLHQQPYWRKTFKLSEDMFPVSQNAYEASVSLPVYSKMSDDDVSYVIDSVTEILMQ